MIQHFVTEKIEKIEVTQLVKSIVVEGHSRRGRPLGRWRDRVKEYICERGAI